MENEREGTEGGGGMIPRTLSTSALRIKPRYSFWERLHSTPRKGGDSFSGYDLYFGSIQN
jgi:hypothetical protein